MDTSQTLRCIPHLRLMAACTLIWGFFAAFVAVYLFGGKLPDYSIPRVLSAVAVLIALTALMAACAATLRSRVIIGSNTVEVITGFKRTVISWPTVERVSLTPTLRSWQLQIWADGLPVGAMRCPSRTTTAGRQPGLLTGYDTVQPNTPQGLVGPFNEIRRQWLRHRRG